MKSEKGSLRARCGRAATEQNKTLHRFTKIVGATLRGCPIAGGHLAPPLHLRGPIGAKVSSPQSLRHVLPDEQGGLSHRSSRPQQVEPFGPRVLHRMGDGKNSFHAAVSTILALERIAPYSHALPDLRHRPAGLAAIFIDGHFSITSQSPNLFRHPFGLYRTQCGCEH